MAGGSMRIRLVNIGCKVNRVEIDMAAAQLLADGAVEAGDAPADIVVVNTCTVTAEADKKTRKAVRKALRDDPGADLLVTGCAAVMNPRWFEDLDPRVHVVAKPDIAKEAWDLFAARGGGCARGGADGEIGPAGPGLRLPLRTGGRFRTRAGVKAQDGCNNACTFCIVHVARGASRSVPFDRVVGESRAHASAGVREIVLTGINLGAYEDGGHDLADLMKEVADACPGSRVRVGSVEPCDVSDRVVETMAAYDGRICRHLHLPLQSGSSRVLGEMNRPYDARLFVDLAGRLRAAMPSLSLSTDIIVGFPGETDADFEETLDVAREAAFSKIHVFRYSRRGGTPAALRDDQVDSAVVESRAQRLQSLARDLAFEDARRRLGTSELVLVERAGRGMSESYHPVIWDGSGQASPAVGDMAPIVLSELSRDGVFHV